MTSESGEQCRGAIVLCGGKSSRMGTDKASLPFGAETMLGRVVRLLSEVVRPDRIVVVAAGSQVLPALPSEVLVARDDVDDRGPLEGLAAGLRAFAERRDGEQVEVVYATACDVPLLQPAFVRQLFELANDHEATIPCDDERQYPLAAVYRTSLQSRIRQLLGDGRRSLRSLSENSRTRMISVDTLRVVDATLQSLMNLNTPEDYRTAILVAGLPLSSSADDEVPSSGNDATRPC